MMKIKVIFALIALVYLSSCGSDFEKTAIDKMVVDMKDIPTYNVLLADMDIEDGFVSDTYKHKYKIITEKADGKIKDKETDWIEVSEDFFQQHINDLGMEILSKKDGKVSKSVSPAGYSNYVGNDKYGQWQQRSDGSSFWQFYGQYMFLSSMMNMAMMPRYGAYNDYHNNYRGRRAYYGSQSAGGVTQYGSRSASSANSNTNFARKQAANSSFKNKVQNQVSRSQAKTRAGARSTRRSSTRLGSSGRSRSFSLGGK